MPLSPGSSPWWRQLVLTLPVVGTGILTVGSVWSFLNYLSPVAGVPFGVISGLSVIVFVLLHGHDVW
jgi:hypothetical protein